MSLLDSVDKLKGSLDYHLARANLLTANLTHVDTPNYRPVDLERAGEFKSALHVALQATDAGHIGSTAGESSSGSQFRVVTDTASAVGPDGNGVSLDREAAKIAANNVRYDAIASLVSSELSGLEWAATDGRGG
jgi:flagellar basal-body rod protein FlgB